VVAQTTRISQIYTDAKHASTKHTPGCWSSRQAVVCIWPCGIVNVGNENTGFKPGGETAAAAAPTTAVTAARSTSSDSDSSADAATTAGTESAGDSPQKGERRGVVHYAHIW
jgi:hypothetical protein